MKKLFIAGCGYIGSRVARSAAAAGYTVHCMVRTAEKAAELRADGFDVSTCALDAPDEMQGTDLTGCQLLYLVPPPGGGTVDRRARNFINSIPAGCAPDRIVYISATSVYSARNGEIVTEESETVPLTVMGKRRLDAENAFREYGRAAGVPVIVLRVSGIYGPGRLPLTQISNGQPLLLESESGPSNRIHADDLATVCLAALEKGEDGDIFNVSDGSPCSMTAYFNAVADALGMPRQPQVTMEEAHKVMMPLMLSYVSDSRIVDNHKMLEKLSVTLRYPSMQQGIAASSGVLR